MPVHSVTRAIAQLPRRTKRFIMILGDMFMMPFALCSALLLHSGELMAQVLASWWMFPTVIVLCVPIFARLGLYRAVVRFMGARVVFAVFYGVSATILMFAGVNGLLADSVVPFNVLVMFWCIALFYVGGSRFAVRSFLQRQLRPGERVAIYGAGGAGARLASALVGGQEFLPVAFLDDSESLQGSVINGVEVFDPGELPRLIEDLEISRVLLAMPSISMRRRKRIISRLEGMHVHVQTMPNFSDLISGNARVDEIREVEVADLLGREAVPPDAALLSACIRDRVVLVTGAGGSIGSELCRQILLLKPRELILLDSSESALYQINRELAGLVNEAAPDSKDTKISPLLASVQDRPRVQAILKAFGVQTVYHAAAYKHVPIVENNIVEGLSNNVLGTASMALAAVETGVESFVLVSTDKAVCPTNVMGATKRMAEMVLQGIDNRGVSTRFSMVRFGNVLASSGSVVPLFRDQIRRGGPVTVTHPNIIRYFMTIPEAAQLVLQAGALARGGDVFVLDMGKPVKIADLARRMIHLMGLTVMDDDNPDGDIEIKYTGLRAAEKLYEELLIGKNVMGTKHPMIMRAEEKLLDWPTIQGMIQRAEKAVDQSDCVSAREVLVDAVEEYRPSEMVDLVWQERDRVRGAASSGSNVTPLGTARLP